MTFTAIDFETADKHYICSVGIVMVENGLIVDEFHALIKPYANYYNYHNIRVHGITPADTAKAPSFEQLYPELKKRINGRTIVAHNESFDRSVLQKSMLDCGIAYADLQIAEKWECTRKIYTKKGFKPASLDACCSQMGIALKHHEALSDARACAKLYLMR